MSTPSQLTLQPRKWLHTPKRNYNLPHEVLPYEIEIELPINVILSIYSYLTPKYMQQPKKEKLERMSIELNHKMTAMKELIMEKKRRQLIRERQEQRRKELMQALNNIETAVKLLAASSNHQ